MKTQAALLTLAALAAAYPGMMGSREEMLDMIKRGASAAPVEKREPQIDGLVGTISALTNTITGLLGSVASNVQGSDKRPEKGYDFKAPSSSDSRGPCPGLNLLANHGYLPRDGHVTFGEVLDATARGFNMATDLATVLAVFAVLTDGDIATESWYLGAGPGNVGGLNRHSTVEADISPNREDYYNGCGDNHHLSSRLFKQNVGFAAASSSKQFDVGVMGSQYAALSKFSQANNPTLYFFPFPMIVSLGAFVFYPNFFSNGTYGAGGVANYESISSIIGAKYDKSSGQFTYVPETWPTNWYRRATPYGAVSTLVDGYTQIYPRNPVIPGTSTLGTPNFSAQSVLCELYQGIQSVLPLFISGTAEQIAAAETWALSKLDPVFKGTLLGCPANSTSPTSSSFLYPNPKNSGGPLNPGANTKNGNNVYNKVYFADAPVKPAC